MNRADEPLLERAAQLAALATAWAEVNAGRGGRIAVVGGESGAGKTTLLRTFCRQLDPAVPVLHGAGEALHTARPLGPFHDIAGAGGLLSAAIERAGRPFEVATAALDELGRPAPTVVVLDDMHWADEASLDVLRLLARRLATRPVLVIVAYRDDELGSTHPLRLLLGELPADLTRVAVPPLSAGAVAALAGPLGVDGAELHRKTAGNAFFVTEVLAAPGHGIPDSVRDAVFARSARLGSAAQAVLEAVAVIPQAAELWLLDRLVPGGDDALDAAIAAGILTSTRGTDDPGGTDSTVSFRHELARRALEDAVPPGRRRALHRQLVAALAVPPDGRPDAARLAHHAEAAADGPMVARYARQAGAEAAAVSAHREAAAQYARALRHAAHLDPEELADVHRQHSQECYLADDAEQATASARAAVEQHRRLGHRLAEADALLWLAATQRMNGRLAEAATSMTQALGTLDDETPGPELARAYAAVALAAMGSADSPEALAAGARAMELADSVGDVATYVHALVTVGTVQMEDVETYTAGRATLERGVAMATEAGLPELVGRAYNNLAYEGFAHFDLDLAESAVHPAVAYASARGVDLWLNVALGSRAEIELFRGNWDAAAETAGQVIARAGTAVPRMGPLTVLGQVRARRGDPDPWGPLDEALDIAEGTGELQCIVPVLAARAEAAWLEGRPDAVLAESEPVLRRAVAAGDAWALADIAYWRRCAGATDDLPPLRDGPRRLQLAGRDDEAAAQWAVLGYPYEAALARADGGSDEGLRAALGELQRLGATAAAALVARRLRERGARRIPRGPRPSTTSNSAHLTRREMEVLAMLADGLGNADIAQRLHLSDRTVGHHVSAVLRKLGVTSRARAAAEGVHRGLVTGRVNGRPN